MVKIQGSKKFEAISSTNAENNSIFLDSSDNTIKIKDNSGNVMLVQSSLLTTTQNTYKILQANNVLTIEDYVGADEFTDSNGTNNTVNTTSSTTIYEDSNLYYVAGFTDESSSGTTYDPDTVTNPGNAFDNDDATYAEKTGDGNTVLGKTFTSKLIAGIRLKVYGSISSTDNSHNVLTIKIKTYDGSTWSDFKTIYSFDGSTSKSVTIDNTYYVGSTISGIAVSIYTYAQYGTPTHNHKYYTIEYGDYDTSSTVVCDAIDLSLDGTEKSIAIYTDATHTSNTGITIDVSDDDGSTWAITNQSPTIDKKFWLVDVNSLSSGTLALRFNLTTSDTSETPEFKGYSFNIIK